MGIETALIAKAGSYFTYKDYRVQGKERMREYFVQHPEEVDILEKEIRTKCFKDVQIPKPTEEDLKEMPEDYDGSDDVAATVENTEATENSNGEE